MPVELDPIAIQLRTSASRKNIEYFMTMYGRVSNEEAARMTIDEMLHAMCNSGKIVNAWQTFEDVREQVTKEQQLYKFSVQYNGSDKIEPTTFKEVVAAFDDHYSFGLSIVSLLFQTGNMEAANGEYFAELDFEACHRNSKRTVTGEA